MRPRRETSRRRCGTCLVLTAACLLLFLAAVLLELRFYAASGVPLHNNRKAGRTDPGSKEEKVAVLTRTPARTPARLLAPPPPVLPAQRARLNAMPNPAIILFCYNRCCELDLDYVFICKFTDEADLSLTLQRAQIATLYCWISLHIFKMSQT